MTPLLVLYYMAKPYVPWQVRIGLRRWVAKRQRERCAAIWPIDEAASRRPCGWTGWPGRKRFAVVLTHDVEGAAGLANCRRLAELEMERGFRSSFNFVPEGEYAVPPALRDWLTGNGFEVGVHDLRHDGKLFRSRRAFERSARRINSYLRNWRADGFRAGFMLRNLEWMHHLDIRYDLSTFDTDPFEPQSEAAGTIFPYWVPSPASAGNGATGGFVELPYTLPQDSTLFLVMQESSPDIWIRKTGWIARHEGMALVNTHPDYIYEGSKRSARTYPVEFYCDWLDHLRRHYAGKYWHPLPGELADWVRQSRELPAPARRSERKPAADETISGVAGIRRRGARVAAEGGAAWVGEDAIEAWDAFVASHPAGTLAHTSRWRSAIEEAFPHIRGRIAAIRDPDGAFLAGMAVYDVKSWILGRRLVSVPFASIAEPVVASPQQLSTLAGFINAERTASNIGRLEVRLKNPVDGVADEGAMVLRNFKQHTLDLSRDEAFLYGKLSRTCIRAWIQKAEANNVVIQTGGVQPDDWRAFHDRYAASRRRLGLPAMPPRFFEALRKHLPPDSLVLQLATQDSQVLGAGLSLVFNGVWILEWVGDSPEGRKVGANQALYWAAVRTAAARGCRTFSFGRTAVSNEGLRVYKRHWGTLESDLPTVLWGADGGTSAETASAGPWRQYVQPVMERAPATLYTALSSLCYRHLG